MSDSKTFHPDLRSFQGAFESGGLEEEGSTMTTVAEMIGCKEELEEQKKLNLGLET